MPAFASASKAAKEQEAKNKIFGEVRAFADDMVNQTELVRGQVRKKPFYEERENRRGVLGGEGVGRYRKDYASPDHGRPPRAQPVREQQLVEARLQFGQLRSGTRIAPGLRVRQV